MYKQNNCIVSLNVVLICISDYFCCEFHVDDCLEVKLECIHYMNELVDFIVSKSAVGDLLSHLSLM